MSRHLRRFGCILIFHIFTNAPVHAASIVVQTWGRIDFRGKLQIAVDEAQPCAFELKGADGLFEVCTLELPLDAREIRLTGEVAWSHYQRGDQRASGTKRWRIVDLAPVVRTLRNADRPFGQRLRDLLTAKAEFEKAETLMAEASVSLELGQPGSAEAVADAEKRLGYALPAEFASLLREVGQVKVGDSYTTEAQQLTNSYDHLIGDDWEIPQRAAERLAVPVQVLKSSVLLFTEVGDGLGGLLYQPQGEAGCGDAGVYHWIHEESQEWEVMKNRDGSCKPFTEAMLWLLGWVMLDGYADVSEDVAVVDRSAGRPLLMTLTLETSPDDKAALPFDLELAWEKLDW